MKAGAGLVALLLALVLVGLLATSGLKSVTHSGLQPSAAAVAGVAVPPSPPASGTVQQQATQLENKVREDLSKAIDQADEARRQQGDKP